MTLVAPTKGTIQVEAVGTVRSLVRRRLRLPAARICLSVGPKVSDPGNRTRTTSTPGLTPMVGVSKLLKADTIVRPSRLRQSSLRRRRTTLLIRRPRSPQATH